MEGHVKFPQRYHLKIGFQNQNHNESQNVSSELRHQYLPRRMRRPLVSSGNLHIQNTRPVNLGIWNIDEIFSVRGFWLFGSGELELINEIWHDNDIDVDGICGDDHDLVVHDANNVDDDDDDEKMHLLLKTHLTNGLYQFMWF